MPKLCNERDCTACSACVSVCPQQCIEMIENEEGFLYPHIDEEKCISCARCEACCPILHNQEVQGERPSGYAAMHVNDDTVRQSSSGGIFTALAEWMINAGGVVIGAAFSENFKRVEHRVIKNVSDISILCTAKYLQSRIGETYKETKKLLDEGVCVLFSGTPCQIAGLKSYLNKEYEKLYTIDLICHGVPSPLVWREYLKAHEKRMKSKVRYVSFREKIDGWRDYSIMLRFENGREYIKKARKDLYMQGFISNMFLRSSCHNCAYKSVSRAADLTLADFWGAEKVCADLTDNKGISLVIVHTEKGEKLIGAVDSRIYRRQIDVSAAIKYNRAMTESSVAHKNREKFFALLKKTNVKRAIKSCCETHIVKKIAKKLTNKVRSITGGEK